jgi:hypothetical protein
MKNFDQSILGWVKNWNELNQRIAKYNKTTYTGDPIEDYMVDQSRYLTRPKVHSKGRLQSDRDWSPAPLGPSG